MVKNHHQLENFWYFQESKTNYIYVGSNFQGEKYWENTKQNFREKITFNLPLSDAQLGDLIFFVLARANNHC